MPRGWSAGRRRSDEERRRLTPRERQVTALVAEGLTNEAIAARLVLVPGTVSNHVEHILRKLGFARRVQIATWAVQHGLWTPDSTDADAPPIPPTNASPVR
jgi:DNA-binding NarL/FixJ family response regulator